jgi:peptide/nickel transport system substrate-binding protein
MRRVRDRRLHRGNDGMTDRRLEPARSAVGRRGFIAGASLLAGAALTRPALAAPQTGGTLRLGMAGGSSSNSLNPTTYTDWMPSTVGYQMMNGLIEIDEHNQPTPELLTSWEAKPGGTEWVLNVRKGISFHNGKTLDADDIIYSINLHRGKSASPIKSTLDPITELKKVDANQILLTLSSANADLPYLLSDYHLMVVPDGFTDWAKPIGTGGYVLESFEPGVRAVTHRQPNYWKTGNAWVDTIQTLAIADAQARTSGLLSGQLDAINQLDPRTVDLLKRNKSIGVVRSSADQHATMVMNVGDAPFGDRNVRLALKYGIDRQKILDTVLKGYGVLGNDHPIASNNPYYDPDIPQHRYDPDKARFYLKQAGQDKLAVTLQVSDVAFSGATDASVLFQDAAKACGIAIDVKREPADGYWDNVWMKAPFCVSYWGGRPTCDQMFTVAYQSTAKWNDSFWKDAQFDKLLLAARGELDQAKRKQMYGDMQRILSEDGGVIIPMFIDYLDACTSKVQGFKPNPTFGFMGLRIGEKVWLSA